MMFLRAIGAVILTGLISPFLRSAGFWAFYAIETGSHFAGEMVLFIALYGIVIALPMAMIMSLFVEYPKLLWLRRNQGFGLPAQLLVSVLGALGLLALFVTIAEWATAESAQPAEEHFFAAAAFTTGGLTSGITWWGLLGRHARAKYPTTP